MSARLPLGFGLVALMMAAAQPSSAQQPAPDDEGTATLEDEADVPAPPPPAKSDKLPARLPWRGTAVSWDHAVTTSALGIGDDFQSTSHQQYVQSFSLGLNYFLVDQEKWSLALATTPSFAVELTNSNITSTEREPWFNDMPVGLAYRRTLHSDPDLQLATGMTLNGTLILPTSPASYNIGTYLTTSPRLSLWQSLPLFGKDSPVLKSFVIGASFRWDHRFGEATTPVHAGLDRPRQDARGSTFLSDDLSFSRLAENTLREGVFLFFSEEIVGTTLQLFASFSFNQSYLPELADSDCEVMIQTGCVDVPVQDQPVQYGYGFAAGLTYFPIPELGVSLGYANGGNQLGPDGKRRSIFYSPAAQFTAGIAVGLDAIFEVITGPRRKDPFFLIAKNDDKKKKEERKATDALPAATF